MERNKRHDLLTLLNRVQDLDLLSPWLKRIWQELGLPAEALFDVTLAVYEALSNIVFYAYDPGTNHEITVALWRNQREVVIKLVDRGKSFNPCDWPEPPVVDSIADLAPSGRGIALIRHLSRVMEYQRMKGENHLTLLFEMPNGAERIEEG